MTGPCVIRWAMGNQEVAGAIVQDHAPYVFSTLLHISRIQMLGKRFEVKAFLTLERVPFYPFFLKRVGCLPHVDSGGVVEPHMFTSTSSIIRLIWLWMYLINWPLGELETERESALFSSLVLSNRSADWSAMPVKEVKKGGQAPGRLPSSACRWGWGK